ncbi:MAG: energy-coupling factor ABC transporter ATP-binding protein [Gracilibacteraceae bacterium]|jgi:energy-coupling factor transport system ATP-binding protein|nr:energy-coupling factor ABC transporter ATP-binding protein [Gracilibacteraceae bacterium]
MASEALLCLENLSCVYPDGTPVLRDLSLEIRAGETWLVTGVPGAGKSTLLRHLNGLLRPTAGRVMLRGADINRDKKALRAARAAVGLALQFPEQQLFAPTVWEDIAFAPRRQGLDAEETAARVEEARLMADLAPEVMTRSPQTLSGGEKRRAALAGIIAARPSVLALDEPLAGLDPLASRRLLARLREWRDGAKRALVIVTHDIEEATPLAERLLVLRTEKTALTGHLPQVLLQAETGLPPPVMTRLAQALAARGVPVRQDIPTVDGMAAHLSALFAPSEELDV